MFHKHDWKEITRTYSGRVNVNGKSQGYTAEEIQRIICGVTTILWECQDKSCQKLRKEELLGKPSKDL